MKFYLGVHQARWLAQSSVPLFVSRRTLEPVRALPRARTPWALDSGGFTELSMHGRWTLSARDYAALAQRFAADVGSLEWAAPQDWMCEPDIRKRTGLTVEEHQARTVANLLELRAIAPSVRWVPVLQGWSVADYWRCAEAYEAAGVDLRAEPLVGVGTVCRRQHMLTGSLIINTLATDGLRLHGFGFKTTGLRACASSLASSDSMAWSLDARRSPALPGHTHRSCANCFEYACEWRTALVDSLPGVIQ